MLPGSEYDHIFKIVLVGDSGVGKTCVQTKFVEDRFLDIHNRTPKNDVKTRTITIDDLKVVKLQIWDTGIPVYQVRGNADYRGCHGVLIFFDLTDMASFIDVKQWLQEVDRLACENVNKMVIGIKCDLTSDIEVDYQTARQFCDSLKITYFECSPKYGINIDEIFFQMASNIRRRILECPITNSMLVVIKSPIKTKKKDCTFQ